MIRTNSFSIKLLISLTLFIFSLFFFYISYQEFSKYYQDDLVLFEDMNINYFDKELFQKYYEKIDIEFSFDGYLPPDESGQNNDFEYENKFKVSWKLTDKVRLYNLGEVSKLKGNQFYKNKVGIEVSL